MLDAAFCRACWCDCAPKLRDWMFRTWRKNEDEYARACLAAAAYLRRRADRKQTALFPEEEDDHI
jgi:hypothetical protein